MTEPKGSPLALWPELPLEYPRPTCCARARLFRDTSFGIVHSSRADYGEPQSDWESGWYLLYDGGVDAERIFFCPFCGKEMSAP